MPIKETLTASPASLGEVLSNGKRYLVPDFQRSYSWGEPEWAELWADLAAVYAAPDDGSTHYLGALVLQPTQERGEMNIIDGQQRLVTLSILAIGVIQAIERLADAGESPVENRERAQLLRDRFVSTKDPRSLRPQPRLRLNRHDNPYFQTYILAGRSAARPQSLRDAEKRLDGALRYFSSRLPELLGAHADGTTLAGFLDGVIAARLRFIEIRVDDDETAYTVFETLNARGIALGTADLLKNYVFSVAAKGGESDLDQINHWWELILRNVELNHVASLLFHKVATLVPDLREKRVFAEVKKLVPRQMAVFDFMSELHRASDVYAALDDPNADLWASHAGARPAVRLLTALGVEQYRPVVLAAFARWAEEPEKIARLLELLGVTSLRAALARVNTGDLQRAYQTAAVRLAAGELKSPAAVARHLSVITPSDDDFRASFSTVAFDPKGPRKRLVRFVLDGLERAAGGTGVDFDQTDATVEHILPENPAQGWDEFSGPERMRDAIRLGNLTPLERSLNKELGAADFPRKLQVYARSRFALTRAIAATEWSPDALRARQQWLGGLATSVWKVDLGGG